MWHELYVVHNCLPELLVFTSVAVGFFGEVELFQSSSEFVDSFFLVELIVTPRISRPFAHSTEVLAVDRPIRRATIVCRYGSLLPSKLIDPSHIQQNCRQLIDQSGQSQQSSHRKSVAPTRISRPFATFNRSAAVDRPIRIIATSSVPDSRPLLPDSVDPSHFNRRRRLID